MYRRRLKLTPRLLKQSILDALKMELVLVGEYERVKYATNTSVSRSSRSSHQGTVKSETYLVASVAVLSTFQLDRPHPPPISAEHYRREEQSVRSPRN
jgi:hypothetical protein